MKIKLSGLSYVLHPELMFSKKLVKKTLKINNNKLLLKSEII